MPNRRTILTALGAGALLPALPRAADAAPASSLIDPYWTAQGSVPSMDHSAWSGFLARFVVPASDGVNRVRYGAAQAAAGELRGYIASLEAADPTRLTRDAQMAYWINLYNAKTVDVILRNYPVGSIREIGGGLFSRGPWDEKVMTVNGRALSLNDVEHGILRPIWNDPRIHYAVNCASIGCPNLARTAWSAASLGGMLDQAARDYATHPRGCEVSGSGLVVSSIYEWYQEDFGNSDQGVIAHLRQYGAQTGSANRISDDRYDWSLNDAA